MGVAELRLALLLLGTGLPALSAQPREVDAERVESPIDLDGRLDEPAWLTATPAALTQQSPLPGRPTAYETTVRVLVHENNLYFGFEATHPPPTRIVVHTKRRDGDVSGDDTLSIVLDSYGDRRTGFFFQTNAAGARVDGTIASADRASLEWDGIWDVRTHRRDDGWSAEFVIPVQSLTFTPGLTAWGVNFERFAARDRITLRWTSPTLDSFLYDLSRAGVMTGTEALQQGRGIEITPSATAHTTRDFAVDGRSHHAEPALDLAWRPTPDLAAVLTVNTDFAETEVDSQQLNVTRFPLFFPERRAFFLEGANQYDFGLGLDGSNFVPFFSRRIGLFDDRLAPIDGGIKLNGRVGRWNVGVLDVRTRDSQFAPGTNLFAGRASYDVTTQWRLGTIVTHGDPNGVDANRLLGLDSVWRTSAFRGDRNLLLGGWFVLSAGDVPDGTRAGWGARLDYPNDRWDCRAETLQFGEAVEPALGFLRRPGTRQYDAACSFQPRPARDGKPSRIRQTFHSLTYRRVDDSTSGTTESWSVELIPLDVEFDRGDRITLQITPQGEQLLVPFELSDTVVLPIGTYRSNRFAVAAATGSQRSWVAQGRAEYGGFFDGTLLQGSASLGWTSPGGGLETRLSAEQNHGKLPQGNFVQRLWQLSLTLALNPNLVLTSFGQYDSESRGPGINTRLRWTIKPGRDLFVVWNRGWRRLVRGPDDASLIPETDSMAIKLRWTVRR